MSVLAAPRRDEPVLPVASWDGTPWGDGLYLVAYGVRLGILATRSFDLDQFAPHLPPGARPARSRNVDRLYSLRVGVKGVSGGEGPHQLYADDVLVGAAETLAELFDLLESDLQLFIAERARWKVFLHAGVVGWHGRAILLPGRSFSGKTTLVAALVRAGASYYSDEYAVLDARGRVHVYPRRLSFRAEDGRGWKRCAAEEFGGRIGLRPLPVGLVAVTRYRPGACWRPRALPPRRASLALLANAVPVRRQPAAVLAALQQVVSRAILIEGIRGEVEGTVDALLNYLK